MVKSVLSFGGETQGNLCFTGIEPPQNKEENIKPPPPGKIHVYAPVKGYLQRMRLQRRLYGNYSFF